MIPREFFRFTELSRPGGMAPEHSLSLRYHRQERLSSGENAVEPRRARWIDAAECPATASFIANQDCSCHSRPTGLNRDGILQRVVLGPALILEPFENRRLFGGSYAAGKIAAYNGAQPGAGPWLR